MTNVLKLLYLFALGVLSAAYQLPTPLKACHAARSSPAVMAMPMAATQLVPLLGRAPEEIEFQLVMDAIEELYVRDWIFPPHSSRSPVRDAF